MIKLSIIEFEPKSFLLRGGWHNHPSQPMLTYDIYNLDR